jgi:hydrogenase maturation protease
MVMNDAIIGLGSPHGNDAVGWRVVEGLQLALDGWVVVRAVAEPTQILEHLEGCRRLWIIDACRCGHPLGAIARWTWPEDARQLVGGGSSTHTMSLPSVLQLAAALGKLPESIVIFAVEIGVGSLIGAEMSDEVAAAVVVLEQRVREEVSAARNLSTSPLR